MLLDGRLAGPGAELFDVGSDADCLDIRELKPARVAPVEELLHRARIRHARVAVADAGGKEFDESGRFRSSANLDLTHALSQPPHHTSPKAADDVVVDHANGLHECIADGRPYEVKSALDQVTAQHSGLLRLSRDLLEPSPSVLDGFAAHELPHVAGEAATLALNDKEGAGIGDRGLDLGAIAYNAVVLHQALNICFRELRQLGGIEARKHSAVGLALSENGEPAQTRLRSLEDQKLEKPTIVVLGHTPLLIVVADIQRIPSPAAAAPHCPSSCMDIITNLWSRSTRIRLTIHGQASRLICTANCDKLFAYETQSLHESSIHLVVEVGRVLVNGQNAWPFVPLLFSVMALIRRFTDGPPARHLIIRFP